MDYRTLLNEHQYEAVSTRAQYCRVVAGAGSGKTRVLTYRISYLIGERGVDPQSIVAIAFTNKVANEMKTRALDLLGGQGEGLTVSTFHSFCAKFLRKEIDAIGFPNNFTIMDEDDVSSLIKSIAVDKGFKKMEPVDVVLRPEDIRICEPNENTIDGTVETVTFKGVHYEIIVDSFGTKWKIHSTKSAVPGAFIGMSLTPEDIHIMHKSYASNTAPEDIISEEAAVNEKEL